jgi:hypothetical protein
MKMLVYVSGPISRGDPWHNVEQADWATLRLMQGGVAVINPMLSMWAGASCMGEPGSHADPQPSGHGAFKDFSYERWLDDDKLIVSRCDAVFRLPGESVGADIETDHARSLGIPVFTEIDKLLAWAAGN